MKTLIKKFKVDIDNFTSACFYYCLLIWTVLSPSGKRKPILTREGISTLESFPLSEGPSVCFCFGCFYHSPSFTFSSSKVLSLLQSVFYSYFHLSHCSLEIATEENNAFSCFGFPNGCSASFRAAAAVWMMLSCSLTMCWGKHSSKVSCFCNANKFGRISGQIQASYLPLLPCVLS